MEIVFQNFAHLSAQRLHLSENFLSFSPHLPIHEQNFWSFWAHTDRHTDRQRAWEWSREVKKRCCCDGLVSFGCLWRLQSCFFGVPSTPEASSEETSAWSYWWCFFCEPGSMAEEDDGIRSSCVSLLLWLSSALSSSPAAWDEVRLCALHCCMNALLFVRLFVWFGLVRFASWGFFFCARELQCERHTVLIFLYSAVLWRETLRGFAFAATSGMRDSSTTTEEEAAAAGDELYNRLLQVRVLQKKPWL